MFFGLPDRSIRITEKDGDPVRKSLLLILVLLLMALCACAAAETEYPLEAVSGKMSFNENDYVVLTPGNLSDHPDLLLSIGKTAEELRSDWETRGVVIQAWSKDRKTCVEVSLVQDDASARYFDTEARTREERKQYFNEIIAKAREQGYVVYQKTATVKKHNNSGNYVEFEYLLKNDEGEHRGIARKIVRNGYTLFVDYQVFGRMPSKTDQDKSRHIINTVMIEKASSVPAVSSSSTQQTPEGAKDPDIPAGAANTLSVTVAPPEKTNSGVFTVEGTAYPGSEVIVVAMRWSGSSYQFPSTAGNNGKYAAKVTLPDEGLYMVTVNMCINNTTITDVVLGSVTFNKTLLPYIMDTDVPETLSTDELILSGTTEKSVEIQCIVMFNGNTVPIKPIKTNGTGKFRFKVPTAQEGEYDITLVFSKKNLSTERKNWKAIRKLSVADNNNRTASKAVKVNYNTLVRKIDSYFGQTIVFDAYVTDIKQVGDQWMITAAQKQNRGKYSNYLIYMADEDPGLAVESKVKIYGMSTGPYEIQSEEGTTTYPGFEYLFFQ